MALALLLIVMLASFICVRIGAVALELTGIPWDRAKFQALSAFSNAGFTTTESEDIVSHPLRRRVATYLIVLGNAGIVTTIGTFVGTMSGQTALDTLIDVGVLFVAVIVVGGFARNRKLGQRTRLEAQRWLSKRYKFQPTTEAMLHFDRGYCMTRVVLPSGSPVIGKPLKELALKEKMVQVLAYERSGEFHPIPGGDDVLEAGDTLVLYGTEDTVNDVFRAPQSQRMSIIFDTTQTSSMLSMPPK